MIKENELRIGNLLNYKTSEDNICPAVIDWQDIKWISENPKDFNISHSPIELNSVSLYKMGFQKIDTHRFKIRPTTFDWFYTYSIHDNAFRFYVNDSIVCLNVIHYVHELQNLYFMLNNEELEFNMH